ncbi:MULTISPECIES: SGNH/GDSL hydrolase family protein [Nonomuraea]|uniref:Lysophospholipase L1-like esterase n=2 Tax=Nonomuraea TaxID=83681 RepID=A0A7W5VDW0_9ACTN|nr:GDSL-type esterase/lipase family protein [Nonomuraea dietziae]MBB3733031.1 lysophospholipase L1-like esterase [Nonomuraea dietziae]
MIRHVLTAVVLVSGSGSVTSSAAAASLEPLPGVMAALGDSVSAGFNACGWYVSCTSRSWSAGDNAEVRSHYVRLAERGPSLRGHNRNFAVPGATSADLMGQVDKAIAEKAEYVTILLGAQDACVPTEAAMTPVALFRRRVEAAMGRLRAELPGARVFVASIPDLRRLWQVGKDNAIARTFWGLGRICQAMLANPTSTKRADVQRRARVRDRVRDFNREWARACAAFGPRCRTDEGAVFAYRFTLAQVSKWDYFHPNSEGQQILADITFDKGFDWSNDTL